LEIPYLLIVENAADLATQNFWRGAPCARNIYQILLKTVTIFNVTIFFRQI